MAKRLLLVLAMLSINSVADAKAFALVIGAADYPHLRPLAKSYTDATDMADMLKTYGFEVTLLLDAETNLEFESVITEYLQKLKNDTSSIGLIYYSGHGIQVNAVNFLIPTQANPRSIDDIKTSCYNLNQLFNQLKTIKNQLNVVILDASHDNSLQSELSLSSEGLHLMAPPRNTMVVSSAMPDNITLESHTGISKQLHNHTFTHYLIQTMKKGSRQGIDEIDLKRIMNKTAYQVNVNTKGMEKPWVSEISREEPVERRTVLERLAKTNLATRRFANGDPVPEARTAEEWAESNRNMKPVWSYYNNDSVNFAQYGKLYNYYAVSDSRGLMEGWRVPTREEWQTLSQELEATNGSLKKMAGEGNTISANVFIAYPSGLREANATFKGFDQVASWWTNTDYSADHVYSAQTFFADRKISMVVASKGFGYSIRLIKK